MRVCVCEGRDDDDDAMATGSRMRPAILVAGLLLGLLAVTLQGNDYNKNNN